MKRLEIQANFRPKGEMDLVLTKLVQDTDVELLVQVPADGSLEHLVPDVTVGTSLRASHNVGVFSSCFHVLTCFQDWLLQI